MYRPTRFEALVGQAITDLAPADLVRLCSAGVCEADDLEFKQAFYGQGREQNHEIAKDIAAMANGRGGVIVIGVVRSEPDGRAESLADVDLTDTDVDRMRQVIADRVAPMCDFDVVRVTDTGSAGQYVIAIPPSSLAPHAVMRDPSGQRREPLTYWIRNGATTRALSESEVADRYRSRFAASDTQRHRVLELLADAGSALGTVGQSWLQLGVAPSRGGYIDFADRRGLLDFACRVQEAMPPATLSVHGGMTTTVGHRRIILTEDYEFAGTSKYGTHIEVLDDGAVTIATVVGEMVGDDQRPHLRAPVPDRATLAMQGDIETRVLAALVLASKIATDFAGAGGDSVIASTLALGRAAESDSWPVPLVLGQQDHIGLTRQVVGSRLLTNPTPSSRTLPLSTISTTPREAVTAAYMVSLDILSQFGQPNVRSYTADGDIRAAGFGSFGRQAEKWAKLSGLETL
jgi:hypothetical protein